MVQRLPEPRGLFFAAHETPHVVEFRFVNLLNNDCRIGNTERLEYWDVDLLERGPLLLSSFMTVPVPIPSIRAVSRTPLPLNAISTICRLVSGNRPLAL